MKKGLDVSLEAAVENLLPEEELERLSRFRRTLRGRPARVKVSDVLKALVFHAVQGAGTLGDNFEFLHGESYSDSGIAQRRARMPWEMFSALLDAVLRPRATKCRQKASFYKGLRIIGLDGTKFSLRNLPAIAQQCSKALSRRLKAAFAKIGMCVLLEVGLHNPIAAAIARDGESESVLAYRLLAKLPKKSLLLADRLYGCAAFLSVIYDVCLKTRSHFLVRARSNIKRGIKYKKSLPDGSRLIELPVFDQHTQHKVVRYLKVREIRASLKKSGQPVVRLRFWTSLHDWRACPAEELVELYAQRWGHEVYYRHIKRDLWRSELLRSHTVETAAQELAALVIASALLAEQRKRIIDVDPNLKVTHISFCRVLALTRAHWTYCAAGEGIITPRQEQRLARRMFAYLLPEKIPKPRYRSYPRAVRQPIRGWPRKLKNSYQTQKPVIKVIKTARN